MRRRHLLAAALLLALGLCGPARAARVVAETAPGFDAARPVRVAFIPPLAVPAPPGSPWVSCPIAGESFVPCSVSERAESELAAALAARLSGLPGVTLVPAAEVNAAMARLKGKDPAAGFSLAGPWQAELAREAGADYALTGFIYCWRDRSGSAWGTSSPAAISFCLHLIEVGSDRVMWRMRYEDEQRPLSDNLLEIGTFIRRGGKWVTSAEMAVEAAAEMRRRLPWSKP